VRQRPPNKMLGIAITDQALLIAEVVSTGAGRELRRCAVYPYPTGSVPANLADLGRGLGQFLRQQGFTARQLVIGVPGNWLLAKAREIPPANDVTAANLLRLQAEGETTAELQDMVYDYAGQADRQHPRAVLVLGAPGTRITQISDLAQDARLSVRAIVPSIMALATASRTLVSPAGLVVYIGPDFVEYAQQKGATVQRLRQVVLAPPPGGGSDNRAAPSRGQQLAAELQRAMAAVPQNGAGAPKLVLWDGSALDEATRQVLATRLGATIEFQNLAALGLTSADAKALRCVPALSLALAGLDGAPPPVDFAHSRMAPPRQTSTRRKIIGAAVLGSLLLLAAGNLALDTQQQARQAADLQATLAKMAPDIEQAKAAAKRLAYARNWFDNDLQRLACLADLTRAFPDDGSAWAMNVDIQNDLKGQIAGKATNWNSAQWIGDRLGTNNKFKDVKVLDLGNAGRTGNEVSFSVSFTFVGTPPATAPAAPPTTRGVRHGIH